MGLSDPPENCHSSGPPTVEGPGPRERNWTRIRRGWMHANEFVDMGEVADKTRIPSTATGAGAEHP